MFWFFGCEAYGIWVPCQGSNLNQDRTCLLEDKSLTTGHPGMPLSCRFFRSLFHRYGLFWCLVLPSSATLPATPQHRKTHLQAYSLALPPKKIPEPWPYSFNFLPPVGNSEFFRLNPNSSLLFFLISVRGLYTNTISLNTNHFQGPYPNPPILKEETSFSWSLIFKLWESFLVPICFLIVKNHALFIAFSEVPATVPQT